MNVATNAAPNLKKVLVVVFTSMISLCAAGELAVPNACMIVYDATQPTVTLQGDASVSVLQGASYSDPGATAADNMDGNVTARIVVTNNVNTTVPGSYSVTYSVADSAGNVSATVSRGVLVYAGDTVRPVIVLRGSPSVTVEALTPYADAGATATDNVDGDITSRIVTVNSVNSSKIGNYAVTYDVADSSGNAALQVIRNVKVVDTTRPVITPK
jgi:hypothetical protein